MLPIDDSKILLYLVRHGQTTLNAEGCYRGPENPPLDKIGYKQAHNLAALLKPISFCAIFHSDKSRASETARIIHEGREEPNYPNNGLQAWNVGWFGGKPKSEYADQLEHYVQNPDERVPEGESLNEFRSRIRPLFGDAIKLAIENGKPTLLVVHSSVIHEAGEAFNHDHSSSLVLPGGVAAVYINKDFQLECEPIFRPDLDRAKSPRTADTIS